MGSIADKLNKLLQTKENIRVAINDRGVEVNNSVKFADYPEKIRQIEGGIASTPAGKLRVRFISPEKLPNSDFLITTKYYDVGDSVTSFPVPPVFDGLTFQEWTHDLSELTNLKSDIDVGAVYKPSDGKTHAFITLTKASGLGPIMSLTLTGVITLQIDWGDGTSQQVSASGSWQHIYPQEGNYEITIGKIAGDGTYDLGGHITDTAFWGSTQQPYR